MKKNEREKRNATISGAWKSPCDGEVYSKNAHCRVCGKTFSGHGPSIPKHEIAKSKCIACDALDKTVQIEKIHHRFDGPVRVRITRGYGSSGPLDRDNLLGACKALRDLITSKILCRNDDVESETLDWEYHQAPGDGVMVEIYAGQYLTNQKEKNND